MQFPAKLHAGFLCLGPLALCPAQHKQALRRPVRAELDVGLFLRERDRGYHVVYVNVKPVVLVVDYPAPEQIGLRYRFHCLRNFLRLFIFQRNVLLHPPHHFLQRLVAVPYRLLRVLNVPALEDYSQNLENILLPFPEADFRVYVFRQAFQVRERCAEVAVR